MEDTALMSNSLPLAGVLVLVSMLAPPERTKPTDKRRQAEEKPPVEKREPLRVRVVTLTGTHSPTQTRDTLKVFVAINGDDKLKRQLMSLERPPFKSNMVDTFDGLEFEIEPEKVESIRISVTGKGMWSCNSTSFQFFYHGKETDAIRRDLKKVFSAEPNKRKQFSAVAKWEFDIKAEFEPGETRPGDAKTPKGKKPAPERRPRVT